MSGESSDMVWNMGNCETAIGCWVIYISIGGILFCRETASEEPAGLALVSSPAGLFHAPRFNVTRPWHSP